MENLDHVFVTSNHFIEEKHHDLKGFHRNQSRSGKAWDNFYFHSELSNF